MSKGIIKDMTARQRRRLVEGGFLSRDYGTGQVEYTPKGLKHLGGYEDLIPVDLGWNDVHKITADIFWNYMGVVIDEYEYEIIQDISDSISLDIALACAERFEEPSPPEVNIPCV